MGPIHQIWYQGRPPAEYDRFRQSWIDMNPETEYRLWDGTALDRLVVDHYPQFAQQWSALESVIKRCDAGRYLILHRHGGVYADLDTEALRPIEGLRARTGGSWGQVVLSLETHLPQAWKSAVAKRLKEERGHSEVVGNAVIISEAGAEFWLEFLEASFLRAHLPALDSFSTWHLTAFLETYEGPRHPSVIESRHLLDAVPTEGATAWHRYDGTWFDASLDQPWRV